MLRLDSALSFLISAALVAVIALMSLACAPQKYPTSRASTLLNGIYGGRVVPTTSDAAKGTVSFLKNQLGFCTGTVISKRHILTAAHCFVEMAQGRKFHGDVNAFSKIVEVGFGPVDTGEGGQGSISFRRIKNVAIHPGFDVNAKMDEAFWNGVFFEGQAYPDIAVIELTQDVPVFALIVPLATRDLVVGDRLTIVGHGIRSSTSKPTNGKSAPWYFTSRVVTPKINPMQFAFPTDENGGICSADSGGPAYINDKNGRIYVAGVTSFMDQPTCGLGNVAVSTSVPTVLGWIRQQLN
jgi:hypothetical protein